MISTAAQVTFTNIGLEDHLPYAKTDIIKVSRVSNNYAISFYQIDYQAMAVKLSTPTESDGTAVVQRDGREFLIPVGKIVMDPLGFDQLIKEIEQLKDDK